MTRKKVVPVEIPEIVDGMCGLCQHWHKIDDDDEYRTCAMLAVWHVKETKVKRPMIDRDTVGMGALKRLLVERERSLGDGFVWVSEGGGEIVPQEDFSDTPRFYIDDYGQKVRIWSPLTTAEWFACSRYQRGMVRRPVDRAVETTIGQMSLFEVKVS